jgi:hypothetical protein
MPAMSEARATIHLPRSEGARRKVGVHRLRHAARPGRPLVRDPVSGTGPIMSVFREVG